MAEARQTPLHTTADALSNYTLLTLSRLPSDVDSEQYILYSVHCRVYTVQYTLYTIHCKVYNVQYTLYSIHCTLYTVQPQQVARPCLIVSYSTVLHYSGLYCTHI